MLRTFVAAAAVVLASQISAPPTPTTVRVTPYFTVIDNGPAFFVECSNTTGETRSSGDQMWARILRIDGKTVQPDYGIGPGLTTEVKAGATWRGIIALRQSYQPYFPPVKFGALVRASPIWPLDSGRHTISVQCPGGWSDDLEFYWEATASPSGRQAGREWGPVNKGLRMAMRPANVAAERPGEWQVDVAIENVGDSDVLLTLGFMTRHVLFPQSVRLILTDSRGGKRELQYTDPRYPVVDGRLDDYIVFLRTGSTYTLRLSWDRYWSGDIHHFDAKLPAGEYQIEARFTGRPAQYPREIAVLDFWEGALESQPMAFRVR